MGSRPVAVAPDRRSPPCVVHLVRAANGPAPLRRFLQAMRRHPAGIDCELVLAMKGFAGPGEAQPLLELAADRSPEVLYFPDEGVDLTVYLAAAARLRRDRYCFVNSFSEPLVDGWLAALDAALALPGVGLVGATGSWASNVSRMAHLLYLPSAYRGALPERNATLREFLEIDVERNGGEPSPPPPRLPPHRRWAARALALREVPGQVLPYRRFPSDHVRTNAFMITQATLSRLRLGRVPSKRAAYWLENGRRSLTRRVQRLGLRTLVVDRQGAVYDSREWHRSRTFWQGEQEGLLVADNQTRRYAHGDADRRRLLSAFAWGAAAEPAIPSGRASQPLEGEKVEQLRGQRSQQEQDDQIEPA